ncbi:MAG: hypothetical protein AAGG01_20635 [Planctomycetota bacterium]
MDATRWLLATEGLRIEPYSVHDEEEVTGLRRVESQSEVGRLSHVLATALRSEKLFLRVVDPRPARVVSPEIALLQRGTERSSLASGSQANFGLFLPHGSSPRIDFDYVSGGPWACLSHDVVVHETLHGMVHRYWELHDAPRFDRGVIEESLADVLAWLSAGRHVALRRWVIAETNGDLSQSNALSRFGGDAPGVPVIRDTTAAVPFDPTVMQATHAVANALSAAILNFASSLVRGAASLEDELLTALNVASKCAFGGASQLSGIDFNLKAFATKLITQAEENGAGARMRTALGEMGFAPAP